MVTHGEYREDGARFGLILNYDKEEAELVLVSSGNVWASFKTTGELEYCYGNTKAKQVFNLLQKGIKGCTAKNAMPAPFVKGTVSRHTFKKSKVDYRIDRYNGQLAGAEVIDVEKNIYISLEYYEGPNIIPEIPYIKMTVEQEFSAGMSEEEAIRTRTLEEISLEKDVTWLKNKKYYIVNDDETVDKIISIIENYKGVVSYDTETTGLKMNMFSKVNSKWQKELNEYNAGKPKEEQIRADRLVGVIFCVEKDISYYFPVFNRKFKNVFEDVNSPVRNRIANNIKTFYTIGEGRNLNHDMARYFRDTPINDMTPDTLFMERCRKLLETCSIGAHHGSFEWAVSWCYNIDINLVDDSMILHQLMYKFRSTTSNKGEPSNLKYLTKREFGIDQLELEDFFVGYKEDESGEVRGTKKKKKKKAYIDFSYMDYEGAQAYAPADGDFTLGLIYKYKYDLVTNHPELEYLYHVEVLVACAIGYMEFYGHRLDEEKINRVRDNNRRKMLEIEHQIRTMAGASEEAETSAFAELAAIVSKIEALDEEILAIKSSPEINTAELELKQKEREGLFQARQEQEMNCRKAMADSSHAILLSSPAQVANLFYDEDKMSIPCPEDKKSVAKKTLKPLLKMKNEDGSLKYPIVHLYTEWKKLDTLLTKFFDNLQNFMYPGGFIFSSYGQISTATGRMSCIEENTQIRLVGGQKAIKDVKVGDLVYCYDEEGNVRIKKVLNVIDNGYKDCIKLNWESRGTHDSGELICTPDHKIRLTDGSWVEAGKISYGSRLTHLRVSDDKRHDEINSDTEPKFNTCTNHKLVSSEHTGIRHVYDLEVEDCHNFIANEVCVHNCSKPNAQQYPKDITGIVIPRDNYVLFDADFSQIEYRTLVAMAKEEHLAETFKDPDSDYHTLMASLMYSVPYASVTPKMRSDAKSFNFGIPYGMGFKSLAILLTGMSNEAQVEEAKVKYELYFKDQPKVRRFFENVKESALVNKYTQTYFGRRRYYSFVDKDGNASNKRKAMALRQAGNAIIQGCLAGETRIKTQEYGEVDICNVVNQHLMVWDGAQYVNGDITYSGKKQKCIITFENNQRFVCSPIHKFLVKKSDGTEEFVKCQNLQDSSHSDEPHRVLRDKVIGGTLAVTSVEITDEYIDMYDVCNTDGGYYVADGVITHNTAADIFKISVARNFTYIRNNGLLGLVLIINMIHDEQLMEINCDLVNVQRALRDIVDNMEFKISGFPPLYVGAGIGMNWKDAKGKMAEIHPNLAEQLSREADSMNVWADHPVAPKEILDYFNKRVYEFRFNKVKDYLTNPENFGKDLHPAIGNLINLQFTFGLDKLTEEAKIAGKEQLEGDALTQACVAKFIEVNNLNVNPNLFKAIEQAKDIEEDEGYEDDEDELEESEEGAIFGTDFALIDDDDALYGVSLQDLIGLFGLIVSSERKVCGIDIKLVPYQKKEEMFDYLESHSCTPEDEGAMQVIFLRENNVLYRTQVWVRSIDGSAMSTKLRLNAIAYR